MSHISEIAIIAAYNATQLIEYEKTKKAIEKEVKDMADESHALERKFVDAYYNGILRGIDICIEKVSEELAKYLTTDPMNQGD